MKIESKTYEWILPHLALAYCIEISPFPFRSWVSTQSHNLKFI